MVNFKLTKVSFKTKSNSAEQARSELTYPLPLI